MTKVEITGEPAEPESFYTQQPHLEQTQSHQSHQSLQSHQSHQSHQTQQSQQQTSSPSTPYYVPQVNDNGHTYDDEDSKNEGKTNNSNSATLNNNAAYYRSGLASRLSALGARAASPINMLANRMGSEGFLPETMFKECEKAARVLRGFAEPSLSRTSTNSPSSDSKGKQKAPARRSLIHIPASVLHRAVGLAIFTTGRVGIHVSGATGSGVLIARRADGSWSPPSGIQVHSVGAGFILGADIYDCVLVLNTREALEAFTSNTRLSLGSSLGVTAGPYGVGGGFGVAAGGSSPATKGDMTDGNVPPTTSGTPSRLMDRAVYSYIKSRGIYAGIKIDGTVVTSRQSANASFYGAPVTVQQILRGDVPPGLWQSSVQVLMDAIRVAETSPFQGQPPHMPPRPQQQAQYPQYTQQYPQQYPQQPGQAYPQQWYAPAQAPSASWGVPGPEQPSPQQPTAQREATPVVSPVTPAIVTLTSTPTMTAATPAARSKEQEAAEEAAASAGLPPPTYSMIGEPSSSSSARDIVSPMTTGTADDEAPPAYVDEHNVHPSDSKSELQ
ncbi:hypothetical protein Sste5346_000916 [Sporothrix stenoceras]|uniref:Ysc84 actin-binding domain-containing protein n=1 Tax=Sporothrix stenoceras TaxID=5173 RepID=A0ABR3ZUF4_9PEZI